MPVIGRMVRSTAQELILGSTDKNIQVNLDTANFTAQER